MSPAKVHIGEIKIDGLDRIKRKITNRAFIEQPVLEMLTEAGDEGEREAKRLLAGGTGKAARSIVTRLRDRGVLASRVVTPIPLARLRSIDQGRKPGIAFKKLMPGIVRWRRAVGITTPAGEIVQQIRRRGTAPKEVFSGTAGRIQGDFPRLLSQLGAAIRRHWES